MIYIYLVHSRSHFYKILSNFTSLEKNRKYDDVILLVAVYQQSN